MYSITEPTDCKTWYHRISRQTKRHGVGLLVCLASSCSTENVYAVEAHVLSHEDRPGTHITIPRIFRETDISRLK